MRFLVYYEVPPARGVFRMEVEADSSEEVLEKLQSDPHTQNYRIIIIKRLEG